MFKQQTFKLRLRNLRQAYNLTHDSLCQICITDEGDYISQSTLSFWENAKKIPAINNIQILADIFAVNLDWLTGRSDEIYSESVLYKLEPFSPFSINIDGVEIAIPLMFPDEYRMINERRSHYSYAARANIVFLLHVLRRAWHRYCSLRLDEFYKTGYKEQLSKLQKQLDFEPEIPALKDIKEITAQLNKILADKEPIWVIK